MALALLACPSSGRAAVISEVFLSDGAEGDTPNAIEFAGLDKLAADTVDLIVIDAGPRHYGEVKRVVSMPANLPYMAISEQAWPDVLWGQALFPEDFRITLDELNEGDSLEFAGARSLLLYDGVTNLNSADDLPLFDDFFQYQLEQAGVTVLDQITFSIDGATVAEELQGSEIDVSGGDALVRAYQRDTHELDTDLFAGTVTDKGTLIRPGYELRLTPGTGNFAWQPTNTLPEPATAAPLLTAFAFLLVRRPARHCSTGSGRL